MNTIPTDLKQTNTSWKNTYTFKIIGAILFIVCVGAYVWNMDAPIQHSMLLMTATVFGAYMALNIGANDVANNVGPAVGSQAITLTGAIIIAAIFEAMGAIVAGGDVVSTIKKGIIDPSLIQDANTFMWLMMAALLAAALWLNIATAFNAPVSTTHSIVGGVLGAGIAAGGTSIANWPVFGKIAASWVISPVMGGIIAAVFLYIIKRTITYQEDMVNATRKVVPVLIAFMVWAFSTYLMLKGIKKIWKVDFFTAAGMGFLIATAGYFFTRRLISKTVHTLLNDKKSVDSLFTVPLICSAALLSFAHGANDVANAIGPLAAINDAVFSGDIGKKVAIPMWIMMVGALGISVGLALFGAKLIKTVGSEITELDKIRAFCISMAAAITVIIASQLGLPVSSTHTAVGAIFGVGFLREYLKFRNQQRIAEIRKHHELTNPEETEEILQKFNAGSLLQKKALLQDLKQEKLAPQLTKKEIKSLKKSYKTELVKRSHLYKIATAWIITVPLSALLSSFIYFAIRGYMLP